MENSYIKLKNKFKKLKNEEPDSLTSIYEIEFLKTRNGEDIHLPKNISWKKELALSGLMVELYEQLPMIKDWLVATITNSAANQASENEKNALNAIVDAIPTIITQAPQKITQAVSLILNKETQWVEEELNVEVVIEVLAPFLLYYFQMMSLKVKIPKAQTQK